MRKLTVKDFIIYNAPCFSCGQPVSAKLFIKHQGGWSEHLSMVFSNETLEIDLTISYSFSLKLKIYHKTNKFIVNNLPRFKEYLDTHTIYLTSKCNKCGTYIDTNELIFDLTHNFILPIYISNEYLSVVINKETTYLLISSYEQKNSLFVIQNKTNSTPTASCNITKKHELTLPLLTLEKLKTRDNFVNKMKTYLIFS